MSEESIHVYLDEQYSDQNAKRKHQVTSLTGVYLPAIQVVAFRKRYFSLLRSLFISAPNHIPRLPEVHASDLFRDQFDKIKFQIHGRININRK